MDKKTILTNLNIAAQGMATRAKIGETNELLHGLGREAREREGKLDRARQAEAEAARRQALVSIEPGDMKPVERHLREANFGERDEEELACFIWNDAAPEIVELAAMEMELRLGKPVLQASDALMDSLDAEPQGQGKYFEWMTTTIGETKAMPGATGTVQKIKLAFVVQRDAWLEAKGKSPARIRARRENQRQLEEAEQRRLESEEQKRKEKQWQQEASSRFWSKVWLTLLALFVLWLAFVALTS